MPCAVCAQDLDLARIERPNQVWAMDITYIPMAKGFVYLAVVLDWFSRRVLSWRLSITLGAAFCIEALQEALARHGKPEIVNTDQGSQFTGAAFTGVLAASGVDSIAASLPSGASPRSPAGRIIWSAVLCVESGDSFDSVDDIGKVNST
jgi:Integrase core domain